MTDLREAFDRAWKGSEYRSWQRGVLGKPDGSGGYTVAVTDRPGHFFVRVAIDGSESVTTARTNGKIPARGNLPVKMRLEPGSGYVILEVDTSGYFDAATANDTLNVYGVPQHTHDLASGMPYMVEAMRVEPGLVRPGGGFDVIIEAARYYYDSTWDTYPGETLSLSSNQPSTTGKHRLVVVCLDPATNTATAVNGSDQDYATTLAQVDIDAVAIGDKYPLGAVLIREDDSDIETQSKYIDARGWLNYADSLTFDDTEGDPEDVTDTAADGTSEFAARRDHVHAYSFDDAEGDPANVGTTADGTSAWPARRDHVHAISTATIGSAIFDDSEGDPADVGTTADGTSTYASRRDHVHGLADDGVSNAKLANMAEATIKGRAVGAGTGDPTDLTAGQAAAIVGTGALDVDTTAIGNVGTGEDTIATYTIPADTLASDGDSIWFEAHGSSISNSGSHDSIFKVYFGATLIHSGTGDNWGTDWVCWGRIIRTGATTQKAYSQLATNSGYGPGSFGGGTYIATPAETLSGTVELKITAEATNNDDLKCEAMIVGKTPA